MFDSGRPMAHQRVREEMRRILEEAGEIGFLDGGAQRLLLEARAFYAQAALSSRAWVMDGEAVLLLPWAGDFANNALILLLRALGLPTGSNDGLVVTCEGWPIERLIDACSDIAELKELDLLELLENVENLGQGKWDWALPRELLVRSFASMSLDIQGAKSFAAKLVENTDMH